MDILIRDTTEADIPELLRIHVHPLVRLHEHRLESHDTIDGWKRRLFGSGRQPSLLSYRSTTILLGEAIVGQITHHHLKVRSQQMCYCGWSLDPAHWGRGIAAAALGQLFDSLFEDDKTALVISDCFANNQRCIRLLQKLHYEPASIGLVERLRTAIRLRCLRWIRRFVLHADRWRMKSGRSAASA